MSRDIFISTTVNDVHAAAVSVALGQLGVDHYRWVSTDMPTRQTSSIYVGGSDRLVIHSLLDGHYEMSSPPRVFWNRRVFDKPYAMPVLHPGDARVATDDTVRFKDNIMAWLNLSETTINDEYSSYRAENKALQLYTAKSLGMRIPPTLVSNDPRDIKEFIAARGRGGRAICKTFRPHVWSGDRDDYVSHTSLVTMRDLPPDEILSAQPMIFQTMVEKSLEIRLTYFDGEIVTAGLNSKRKDIDPLIDWRAVSPSEIGVIPIETPSDVQILVRRLMRSLGLKFGCLDFAISGQNWHFLEVNQMGQFLWLEEANPAVKVLSPFLNMLLTTTHPHLRAHVERLDFSQVLEEGYQLLLQEKQHRVPRSDNLKVSD